MFYGILWLCLPLQPRRGLRRRLGDRGDLQRWMLQKNASVTVYNVDIAGVIFSWVIYIYIYTWVIYIYIIFNI